MITSVKPCSFSSRAACSITGTFSTGAIGFGIRYVSGRSRVPSPAARIIGLSHAPAG